MFLDEFDAIAKARNDEHEVGELKRVVNSLLQNIDDFNENNILIAATNHENLLDPAVWRRFSNLIEVPKPTDSEVVKLIKFFLRNANYDFKDDLKKTKRLGNLLSGLSPSDIKSVCYSAMKLAVINGLKLVTYPHFICQIYLHKGYKEQDTHMVKFLNENGVTQFDISTTLGISIRQVRKHLGNEVDLSD